MGVVVVVCRSSCGDCVRLLECVYRIAGEVVSGPGPGCDASRVQSNRVQSIECAACTHDHDHDHDHQVQDHPRPPPMRASSVESPSAIRTVHESVGVGCSSAPKVRCARISNRPLGRSSNYLAKNCNIRHYLSFILLCPLLSFILPYPLLCSVRGSPYIAAPVARSRVQLHPW
jgi:hypothetical protein